MGSPLAAKGHPRTRSVRAERPSDDSRLRCHDGIASSLPSAEQENAVSSVRVCRRRHAGRPRRGARLGASICVASAAAIWLTPSAIAESRRCVAATIEIGVATPVERGRIAGLWNDLGGSAGARSSGPLACPLNKPVVLSSPGRTFVAQEFQHGWILIGRSEAAAEIVAVHSLGQWWLWWKGLPPNLVPAGGKPLTRMRPPTAPGGTWSRAGRFATAAPTQTVTLWSCQQQICVRPPAPKGGVGFNRFGPASPALGVRAHAIDFASSLTLQQMSEPSALGTAFTARVNAAFPAWMPCFTAAPELGEDGVARALVLMRGVDACPVTGITPRTTVMNWLRTLKPFEELPGTDIDGECARAGDLDVTIAGLLNLALYYRLALDTQTMKNLVDVLQPWGGKVRASPYVEPDGTCYGFDIIETENHLLMQEIGRYLINQLLAPRKLGSDYDNAANGTSAWIHATLRLILRRDFYEFNSLPYTRYALKPLLLLRDHANPKPTRDAAEGVIGWLLAKQAVASNLDRDVRPFRRQPIPSRFNVGPWFSSATTATTAQNAILVGPPQHVGGGPDLNTEHGAKVFQDANQFPDLGTVPEAFLADFTDVMHTKYTLPRALRGWLEHRYDDALDRETYLQLIHHREPTPLDTNVFMQTNNGLEIYSGNRNWTMAAGGAPAGPSIPQTPPGGGGWTVGGIGGGAAAGAGIGAAVGGPVGAVVGGIIGGILGGIGGSAGSKAIAGSKQEDKLWDDQTTVMQPTILIPTQVGLDRTQTIRFGLPVIRRKDDRWQPRICVAEGFMCGLDLIMPAHPFPDSDPSLCPIPFNLPPPLAGIYQQRVKELGCLVMPEQQEQGWRTWAFDRGRLIINSVGPQRWAAAYISDEPGKRKLVLEWDLLIQSHDWFNVYAYPAVVWPTGDDAPGGWLAHALSGDPDDTGTTTSGKVEYSLEGKYDTTYSLLVEGCDPTYFLFFHTGHECHANLLPAITVNVGPKPPQPFSCQAEQVRGQGIAMQVGEVDPDGKCKSRYGMYVFVWTRGCFRSRLLECPDNASNFGYVVAAPARGWSFAEFLTKTAEMHSDLVSAYPTLVRHPSPLTITVPAGPALAQLPNGTWIGTGPIRTHNVSFRWRLPNEHAAAITGDTGRAGPLINALGPDTITWPLAAGTATSPDDEHGLVIDAPGNSCFTVVGPHNQADPHALIVDLRKTVNTIRQTVESKLANDCA
jgi:hypothetical protein